MFATASTSPAAEPDWVTVTVSPICVPLTFKAQVQSTPVMALVMTL